MGAGPVGFQYAAEVCSPAPESTSQGLLLLAGQVSGLVFVEVMFSDASMRIAMLAFVALGVGAVALASRLRESPVFQPPR